MQIDYVLLLDSLLMFVIIPNETHMEAIRI